MKEIQESHVRREENDDEQSLKIWDCGSPLYDSYELVAVSHLVERQFMILPYLSGSRNLPTSSSASISSSEKSKREATAASKSAAGKSSVISFLSEFLERNVLKIRKIDRERKHKAKTQKTGISKIFPWRK